MTGLAANESPRCSRGARDFVRPRILLKRLISFLASGGRVPTGWAGAQSAPQHRKLYSVAFLVTNHQRGAHIEPKLGGRLEYHARLGLAEV